MIAGTIVFVILVASVIYLLFSSMKREEEEAARPFIPDSFTEAGEPVYLDSSLTPAPTPESIVKPGPAFLASNGDTLSDGASRLGLAPGWYPDPDGSHETYFDGSRWGETRERVDSSKVEGEESPSEDGDAPTS